MTQEMNLKKWMILLLTAGLFGSSFPLIKLTVESIPPLTLAASRSGIAALIVYGFMRASGQRFPKFGAAWLPLITLGLLMAAIPYTAIAWGQEHIDSSLGGILFAIIPIFTVLMAPLFLAEEIFTRDRLLGVAIGFLGVILIVGPQALGGLEAQIFGTILTLIAAFSYSTGGIFARTQKELSPVVAAAGQLTTASIMLGILSIIVDAPRTLSPTLPAIISLIAVAIFSTAITVLLFFWLIRNAGATNTSLLAFFIPVAAVVLGVFTLGETLSWGSISGFFLILFGALIVTGTLKIPNFRTSKSTR